MPVADILSACEVAHGLTLTWLKNKNGACDNNVRVRRSSLRSLAKDLNSVVEQFSHIGLHKVAGSTDAPSDAPTSFLEDLMTLLMDDLGKHLFRGLEDPAEACR